MPCMITPSSLMVLKRHHMSHELQWGRQQYVIQRQLSSFCSSATAGAMHACQHPEAAHFNKL